MQNLVSSTKAIWSLSAIIALHHVMLSSAIADGVSLTVTPEKDGTNGQTVTYDVTVQNNTAGTIYLNGDSVDMFNTVKTSGIVDGHAPNVAADDNPFLLNAPPTLAPAATYIGSFTLTIGASPIPDGFPTPIRLYQGSFVIFGGSTAQSINILASSPFLLNVTQ